MACCDGHIQFLTGGTRLQAATAGTDTFWRRHCSVVSLVKSTGGNNPAGVDAKSLCPLAAARLIRRCFSVIPSARRPFVAVAALLCIQVALRITRGAIVQMVPA